MSNIESSPKSSSASLPAIRSMAASDLAEVGVLHGAAFPGFFLSGLGSRPLRELYAAMAEDPTGIAIVAESGGRIIGFAAGTTEPRSYYRRLIVRRWWRFARAILPAVLRRPSLIGRLAWRLRSATSAPVAAGETLLLSLAVSPEQQRKGIGRILLLEFLAAARKRGAKQVSLTTDAAGNERVERFYQSLGFKRRAAYSTPEKRLIHDYVIDI